MGWPHIPTDALPNSCSKGVRDGFRIGCQSHHRCLPSRRNLQSSYEHLQVVADYLTREERLGHIQRLLALQSLTLAGLQINPFVVIPKRYRPNKWSPSSKRMMQPSTSACQTWQCIATPPPQLSDCVLNRVKQTPFGKGWRYSWAQHRQIFVWLRPYSAICRYATPPRAHCLYSNQGHLYPAHHWCLILNRRCNRQELGLGIGNDL